MPPMRGNPGAIECGAPEFLDFLIGASPADRQRLYRNGLDMLNAHARKQFNKSFAELGRRRPMPSFAHFSRPCRGSTMRRTIPTSTSSQRRIATSAPPPRTHASGPRPAPAPVAAGRLRWRRLLPEPDRSDLQGLNR